MIDYYEHIEGYREGSLSPEEHQQMKAAMSNDEALKQAVEDYPIAMMISESLIEDEVRGVLGETKTGLIISAEKKTSPSYWKWLVAATMIGLISYIGITLTNKSTEGVIFADLKHEPAWPVIRSNIENENAVNIAIAEYFAENKNKAKTTLSNLNSLQSKYWLSEIYFKESKYDSVVHYVGVNIDEADRTNYIKILSLYALGQKKQAISLINSLPTGTDIFYQDIYEKLRVSSPSSQEE